VVTGGSGMLGLGVAVGGAELAGTDAEGVVAALGGGEPDARLRGLLGFVAVAVGLGRAEPMSGVPKPERTTGVDAGLAVLPNGMGRIPHVNTLATARTPATHQSAITAILSRPPSASARLAMDFFKLQLPKSGVNVPYYYKIIMLKKQCFVVHFRYNIKV